MPEFAWPWLLLALPLPWLVAVALPAAPKSGQAALRVPRARAFESVLRAAAAPSRASRLRPILPLLGWLLLCVAAARPQQLGDASQPPRSGRDLMIAVDLSGSMETMDMSLGGRQVDRLTAIKAVLGDFLNRRTGDRIGLILFGSQAFAVMPLTGDRESVRQQLQTSETRLAGPNTAIGDAIALAVKRLRAPPAPGEQPAKRVLILLTDGENTTGVIEPLKAARLAADEHVRIYTIGFGGEGDAMGLGLSLPNQDDGLDEEGLQAIARQTGGRYFRARDTQELAGIYAELDRVEPALRRGAVERPRIELYPWFLGAALLLAVLLLVVPAARRGAEAA